VLHYPGFEPQQRQEIFFLSMLSRLPLEHTQPFLLGLKQSGHEGDHLPGEGQLGFTQFE
jgi:hypothetical protein